MNLEKIHQMVKKLDQMIEAEIQAGKESSSKDIAPDHTLPDQADASIVLEVGHGPHPDGFEPGAVDSISGTREWDMNKIVANVASENLKSKGYKDVVVTDENDYLFSIGSKYASAQIFVSCHHNAFSSPKAQGCETLVHPDAGKQDRMLAEVINQQISETLQIHNRGIKTMNLGVLTRSTYDRHEKNTGAVLIEPYFITGEDVGNHESWSKKAGKALAEAIHLHLSGNARVS